MTKGYFITGTGTGVGKTVVTAGLLAGFRQRGITAMAM
ncbi:MAG: AAA family ATPase, partial [Heliobacteriaceae bacterium]|nr:AAA family ATPase [Heliobacteriaceae bacterium]